MRRMAPSTSCSGLDSSHWTGRSQGIRRPGKRPSQWRPSTAASSSPSRASSEPALRNGADRSAVAIDRLLFLVRGFPTFTATRAQKQWNHIAGRSRGRPVPPAALARGDLTMDGRPPQALTSVSLTRRQALQLAAGAAALGLTGCAPSAREASEEETEGSLVLLSTQFQPVQEAEKMRAAVLAGFGRKIEFIADELGPFEDRIRAEAQANKGTVAVIGGQHGDLAGLAADGLLTDLSDLTQ